MAYIHSCFGSEPALHDKEGCGLYFLYEFLPVHIEARTEDSPAGHLPMKNILEYGITHHCTL
jgi:hypothetical protein